MLFNVKKFCSKYKILLQIILKYCIQNTDIIQLSIKYIWNNKTCTDKNS